MKAELLFIGTELLMGQVLNTNGQYISRRLQALGVECYHQITLGDNIHRLVEAYRQALSRADIVITTGGIGPTVDDVTKKAAAQVVGKPLIYREEAGEMVKERFRRIGRTMTQNNYQQAFFTADTEILPNHQGTAPGGKVPAGQGKFIFHLPGPPHEMRPMFEQSVVPFLTENSGVMLKSKYIRIVGMGESEVDHRLKQLEEGVNPSLSPYATPGEVVLRATAAATSSKEAQALLAPLISQVQGILGPVIYRIDDDDQGSLEDTVIQLAAQKKQTLCVAESLTAGMIGSTLARVPGASKAFLGGVITYTNQMKEKLLGVSPQLLKEHGAVSHQCAGAMAQGLKHITKADFALGVTGVAGPGPDDEQNPEGLVFIALADKEKVEVTEFHFVGDRQRIRGLTTKAGLNILRIALTQHQSPKR